MKIKVINQEVEADCVGLKVGKFYYSEYYNGFYIYVGNFNQYCYRHIADDKTIHISKYKLFFFKKLMSDKLKPSILVRSIPAKLVRPVDADEQKIIDETLQNEKIKLKFDSVPNNTQEHFSYLLNLSAADLEKFNSLAKIANKKCPLICFEEKVFSEFKPVGFNEKFNYELKIYYCPEIVEKTHGGVDFVVKSISLNKV